MPTRKIGGSGSVFTLGGSALVGDLEDCTISFEVKDAEGKGVTDTDDWPVVVGRSGVIDANLMASGTVNALAGTVYSSTPFVSVSITTGAGTYAGTALIKKLDHKWTREGIQMYSVNMKFQGTPTIS